MATDEPEPTNKAAHTTLQLVIAYVGFVSLGLPDPVAGIAWPSVRDAFGLSQSGFGLVFMALSCGYCASGFVGGRLSAALGVGNVLAVSSGLVALAMFGSGLAPAWLVFVGWAVVWGLGSGAIDAALNAYVSSHFSARHVNWLHACYSLGATLGPLLMAATLVEGGSWRAGYALVGAIVFVMTMLFLATRRRWGEPSAAEGRATSSIGIKTALREPVVCLQIVLFFLYVGLEFTVGQWSFTVLTESRGVPAGLAGVLAGSYYGAIGVGRVLSGIFAERVGLDRIVRFAMAVAIVGAVLFACRTPAAVAYTGLGLIGLGLAPVFPCLMARTPQRLSEAYAAHAFGFQVSSGMLGAALVPGATGILVESCGLESVAWFALVLAAILFGTHELLLAVSRVRSPS